LATQPVAEPFFTDRSPFLVNGRPQTYRVAAVYGSANGQDTEGPLVTLRAIPVTTPPGFVGSSVSEGNRCGSVLFQPGSGRITLRGSGKDIWQRADEFYFLNQPVTGDFQITVQALTTPTPTDEWAKASLMLRESLEAGARNVYLLSTGTHGLIYQWRPAAAGPTDSIGVIQRPAPAPTLLKLPLLLRLTRRGNTITAQYSRDQGRSFQPAGAPYQFDEPLPETAYGGPAITAHDASQVSEAKSDGLEIRKR
jgi:hypothetical protein